jgi:hypothetical protein
MFYTSDQIDSWVKNRPNAVLLESYYKCCTESILLFGCFLQGNDMIEGMNLRIKNAIGKCTSGAATQTQERREKWPILKK